MTGTGAAAVPGPGAPEGGGSNAGSEMAHVAAQVPGHDAILARDSALRQRLASGEAVDRAEREALMADIIAAGASTPPGLHRDRLRNLLFHWAATLALETGVMGDVPVLAPYVARDPVEKAAPAATVPAVAAPQAGTRSDDPLPPTGAADPVRNGISRLRRRTGGWIRNASAIGKSGANVAATPAIPDPELDRRGHTQELVRWGAIARQWRNSRAPGLLVTGNALKAASAFADDDPDIRDFVDASQARRKMHALRALLVAVLVAGSGLFMIERAQHQRELRQLYAEAETMKSRNDFNDRVLAALDALNRQDIEPLKSLLRDLAGLPGLTLDNLTVTAVPSARQSGSDAAASAQPEAGPALVVEESGPAPALPVGTCSGYMWIGGMGSSGPPVSDLTALSPGDNISVTHANAVNLRATPPGEDYRQGRDRYVLGPIVGVVPRGTTATLLSQPEAYLRPTGVRYWAQVEVPRQNCSKVYVQYFEGMSQKLPDVIRTPEDMATVPPQLQAIQDTLAGLGFATVPAEKTGTAAGKAELRYYWPDDATLAAWVAEALSERLNLRISPVALPDVPVKPDAGVLEVWIDLSSVGS